MDKKKLLVLVTGSVGASNVDSYLYYLQRFFDITVVMSESSKEFITKKLISHFCEKVYDQMFLEGSVPHVLLPNTADVVLVLPATANCIGKIANGIADDLVTTSVLNFKGNIIFCPNMNSTMWENKIVQQNVSFLESLGHKFIFETKKSYEVALKKAVDNTCSLPQPVDLVKYILKEGIVSGEGH